MLYGYRQFHCIHKKTYDIYTGIAEDFQSRFDTSSYEFDRPLPKGKHTEVIGLMKGEIGKQKHDKICLIKGKNL